jgi:protein-L-isoaspartate(D-aspartate) O-methyltransferase
MQAVRTLPRARFVPESADTSVADDQPVSLSEGRSIPPVHVVVMMLGALELKGTERVLDIGGGSGYQAAILSQLAREVISVEVDEELAAGASRTLSECGCANVRVMCGDASAGWPAAGPYQAIVVGAAAAKLPVALIEQLDLGGRLVIPLGDSDYQLVERLRKRVDGLDSETIGACRLDLLASPDRPPTSFPWTLAPKL